jgi:glucuronosyltransferase
MCQGLYSIFQHLESFINGSGEAGFIYVSMGTAVKTTNTPKYFFKILLDVFASLPCHVLWNWDTNTTSTLDIPSNIMIERWVPQQDVLGVNRRFIV